MQTNYCKPKNVQSCNIAVITCVFFIVFITLTWQFQYKYICDLSSILTCLSHNLHFLLQTWWCYTENCNKIYIVKSIKIIQIRKNSDPGLKNYCYVTNVSNWLFNDFYLSKCIFTGFFTFVKHKSHPKYENADPSGSTDWTLNYLKLDRILPPDVGRGEDQAAVVRQDVG